MKLSFFLIWTGIVTIAAECAVTASAEQLSSKQTVAVDRLLQEINKWKTGISCVSVEYETTELDENNAWVLTDRTHGVMSLKTGHHCTQLVSYSKNKKSNHNQIWAWDGKNGFSFSSSTPFNPEMRVGRPMPGLVDGTIWPTGPTNRNDYISFFDGLGSLRDSDAHKPWVIDPDQCVSAEKNDGVISFTVRVGNSPMEIEFTPEFGIFSKITSMVCVESEDIIDRQLSVISWDLINGVLFPMIFEEKCLAYSQNGSKSFPSNPPRYNIRRFLADKSSIKINQPIDPKVFTPEIPVGADVTDTVRGTRYKVKNTGPLTETEENIVKHLDSLLEEASAGK